jgi:glycosyltransferase involved in cell wall biosynthesis
MVKISIIIPSYNASEFIEKTIQSILGQDYPEVECIVIDGGSTDGTLDILEKYEGKIIWTSEKDKGESDAINKGLRLASGDIVAYIDADDVYENGCFQKVANFFEKNPRVKWVCGKCKIINENGLEIRKPITSFKNFWLKRYSYKKLLVMNFIPQPAVFWRKELTNEIGLFNVTEHFVMDREYWFRAGTKYNLGFIDHYVASWRMHPRSKSVLYFFREAKDSLRIANKYADLRKPKILIILMQYLVFFSVILIYFILSIISKEKRGKELCHET